MNKQKWSDEETERLLGLMKAHGRDFKTIGRLIGRTPQSAEHRWRWVSLSAEDIAERTKRDKIRQAAIRAAVKARDGLLVPKMVIPDDVANERNRRMSAPLTVSAYVLGDPPVGFSALDRKCQMVTA